MRKSAGLILIVLVFALAASGCGNREEPDQPWTKNSFAPQAVSSPALRVISTTGTSGDIEIQFMLSPSDGGTRDISLFYRGACAGETDTRAVIVGETKALAPGLHAILWPSWDQEAGCAGEVRLRVETGKTGEFAESAAVALDNTAPGQTGFFESPLMDQGINDEEAPIFDMAEGSLIQDPSVDFVATRYGDDYEVYAKRGSVVFQRIQSSTGYQYEVVETEGANPIGRQDPTWISTYDEEIAAGHNPNNLCLPQDGYPCGDERLSFIEPEDDAYPFGYERIAAYFDHPDSADFMVNWKGYAHADMDLGEHGSLDAVQSRSPLVFWGAGIEAQTGAGLVTRQVDIAPTVAEILGFAKTSGVDERGIYSRQVYLARQDGHPVEDILSGETARTAIILVCDGLAHSELQRQLTTRAGKLPNLSRLTREGAWIEHGSITNYPSVTYPSHNLIGSGMYSGHHGLVDNEYYLRAEQKKAAPISELVLTGKYWNPIGPGETLHQGVHRNFGKWTTKGGAFTASLIDPSEHGADKADLQFTDRSGEVPFPPFGLEFPKEIPGPDPAMMTDISVFGEELLVQVGFVELYYLYQSERIHTPMYVIMDVMTTDGAGHTFGPHSDRMERVLDKVDETLGVLFQWLQDWDLAGQTLIVLTSDHGMQIGDISRSSWPMDTLDAAGVVRAADTGLTAYMKIPVALFGVPSLPAGVNSEVAAAVTDEDDGHPLESAQIDATDGVTSRTAFTDERGEAAFYIAAAADVRVTVTVAGFTTRSYVIPLATEAAE